MRARLCTLAWILCAAGRALAAPPETPESAAQLLTRGPPPLLMGGQDHRLPPGPPPHAQPDPLDPVIRQVRTRLASAGAPRVASGISNRDYASIAYGIVQYFRHFQAPDGRIIDPFLHREYQYSTPTYAFAAATLADVAGVADLYPSAARALDSSLFQLASGTPADRHGDFFIVPAMLAWERLQERVDAATRARWEKYLRMIDPQIAYSDLIGPGQPDVMNWNTGAIAGEALRHKHGFTDTAFTGQYVAHQAARFTPSGVYRDPGVPLAYDAEARLNLLLLLEAGYDGSHRKALEVLLERGAWAALLMQSPSGDSPLGGRSAEHAWNDALSCASFELWARRSRASGDMAAASAFKRAARLAGASVRRWVRPSGELWIVKNHFDPAVRRGFEPYSSHSQYNLLAAAYLALAAAAADESIPEGASPADVGGFVVELPELHKVFANSGGHYVEIETGADAAYDGTGVIRVHLRGMDHGLGRAPTVGWPTAKGGWEVLAQFPRDKVRATTKIATAAPDKVEFSVRYDLTGASVGGVTESYTITPDALTVAAAIEGGVADRWMLVFPAFVSDGRDRAAMAATNSGLVVRTAASAQSVHIAAADAQLRRSGRIAELRNGDYEAVEWTGAGREVTYTLAAPVEDRR